MTLLHPAPVPTSQLSWIPENRMFVAEISSIGGRFGRVWDDACDEGLTLISTRRPGQEIVFAVSHTETDNEGDIRYWDLKPAKAQAVPFTVRIYND